MSKRIGKFTKIWMEGYHLSTGLTGVNPSATYAKHDSGGYTQDMSYLIGRGDGTVVMDGFFDPTTDSTHDALKSLASGNTTMIVSGAIGNNAAPALGDPTFHLNGTQNTYDVNPDLNGVVTAHGEFGAKGTPVEWGVLLADATITANGQQSSVDQTAQTTAGGVGYLHITALSAGDTITVLIEDSANDSVWATLITFTLDGTAIDAERIAVTGTVDRYVRASYTVTGSAISFPIAVGFVRG